MEELDRITHVPGLMQGKATIRGMRVTVGMILGQLGAGVSVDRLLEAYPYLEWEDVLQSLQYAAFCTQEHETARETTLAPTAA